jgi:membrane protease YdiL (CAAX protease family)
MSKEIIDNLLQKENFPMENNNLQKRQSRKWLFFIIALGWSWLFWIPLIFLKLVFNTMPGIILYTIGGLGPLLSAIYLVHTTQQKDEQREFWRRIIDFKRIPLCWFFVSLFIPPVIALFSILVSLFLSNEYTQWQPMWLLIQNPLILVLFLVSTLLFGPLPEEIGWRGYGLESLQTKYSALQSSLIVGFFWVIWHIPLFLTKDSGFAALYPLFSFPFWLWATSLLSISIIMTWIFNHTEKSTLTAILFHFSMSATSGFFSFKSQMQSMMLLGFILFALFVLAVSRLSQCSETPTHTDTN